ncbi:nuclear transport factor 2 family protein [Meridianimarinicoccus sp. MJW13]|uniref:nuclear transport factor 2 family protein n=2 Tax=unclassified Meridianimarinicoccus TaxID=2923344 RepID=UPI00299F8737|nr:nuclear transport factor 2 family protein [Fluviibacterium sp. MJW13]
MNIREGLQMDMNDVARELVAGCREGRAAENLDKLYAPDAVSVEAMDNGNGREAVGVEAIRGKHAWWTENFEVHGGSVSDPMPHGDNKFAVIFEMDATMKATGERNEMKEVAVYTVTDGKISHEEFYYGS